MAQGHEGGEILLCAADWQTRTLLLAELREAGYEVLALPGLRQGLSALTTRRLQPALAVLDVVADPHARLQQVEQALRLLEGVPVVLLVGVYQTETFSPLREQVAVWLTRPLRVGTIVKVVRRLCPPAAGNLPGDG